jgi:hypothetical protein
MELKRIQRIHPEFVRILLRLYSAEYFRERHRSSSEQNYSQENCKAKYRVILNYCQVFRGL